MTAQCFNPACGEPFRYFRSGKIFAISSSCRKEVSGDTEYFWLCGNCSVAMRVGVNASGEIMLETIEPLKIVATEARIPKSTPPAKVLRAVS
jgi:hypothetical protein